MNYPEPRSSKRPGRRMGLLNENVFCFVPNLIGYVRVILLVIAFYLMPYHPFHAMFCYLLSGFLDAFDGMAARRFNQSSSFGAVLDMVTDRCSTLCLILTLCQFYPRGIFLFQLVAGLDISSHWFQMYSSLLKGDGSHKVTDLKANPLMRLYYSKPVLFVFCAGNELFFASLYINYFSNGPSIPFFGYQVGIFVIVSIVSFPISFLKNVVSVIQLITAAKDIVSFDTLKRSRAES